MGASFGCPANFEAGPGFLTCVATCPAGFKSEQKRVNGMYQSRCVLFTDKTKGFDLNTLGMYDTSFPEPSNFPPERARVASMVSTIASIAPLQENAAATAREYETVKSQYAGYAAQSDAGDKIKAVTDSIKNPRPPVQPTPINEVKRKILNPLDMSVIQTILFTILLALVEYLMVPQAYAQYLVFLTLCVGASAGIYLSTR